MESRYSKSLSVFYAGREKCESGHFFGPALRPHYLMHVVVKGKGTYETGGQKMHLKMGDVFLIYPNEMTLYRADDQEPREYAWVAFDGYEAKRILKRTGFQGHKLTFQPEQTDLFIERMQKLAQIFLEHEEDEFELTGMFYQVMALMVRESDEPKESYEQQYFQKAVDYICHNYGYPIKISDIAKYVGIDRTYLYKIFMDVEQCAPKQFLIQFRLKTAMNMLETMKYSITETAYSCGFKDAASFCNHFKKFTEMTPKQYQRYQKNVK